MRGRKRNNKSHLSSIFKVVFSNGASPEQRLWAAVLYQAINDVTHVKTLSCDRKRRQRNNWGVCVRCAGRHQARWWFRSSRNGLGSFPTVCEILGLDEKKIRGQLKELKII